MPFYSCQVICEACNNCRDLDLCRDSFIGFDEPTNRCSIVTLVTSRCVYNAHCNTLYMCQYSTCTFYILQSYNVLGRYFIPSFHIPPFPRSTFLHLLIPHSFTSSFHIPSPPHSIFLHVFIPHSSIPSFHIPSPPHSTFIHSHILHSFIPSFLHSLVPHSFILPFQDAIVLL